MKLLLLTLLLNLATPPTGECVITASTVITVNCEVSKCFQITSNCQYDHFQLQVFNRWGNEMTKKETSLLTDLNDFCNSLPKNKDFTTGIYMFSLKADNMGGRVEKMWAVTIIK